MNHGPFDQITEASEPHQPTDDTIDVPWEVVIEKITDPFMKMGWEFSDYLLRGNYTNEQIREAYYRLMGMSEEAVPDAPVASILTKMKELEQQHFAVNHFTRYFTDEQRKTIE